MPGRSSGEVRLLRRRQKKSQSAAQASQKARIIAASEGFAFASTTSWCQSQLQAEASHCKQWQEQPKNTSNAAHQDRRTLCGQVRFAGEEPLNAMKSGPWPFVQNHEPVLRKNSCESHVPSSKHKNLCALKSKNPPMALKNRPSLPVPDHRPILRCAHESGEHADR